MYKNLCKNKDIKIINVCNDTQKYLQILTCLMCKKAWSYHIYKDEYLDKQIYICMYTLGCTVIWTFWTSLRLLPCLNNDYAVFFSQNLKPVSFSKI